MCQEDTGEARLRLQGGPGNGEPAAGFGSQVGMGARSSRAGLQEITLAALRPSPPSLYTFLHLLIILKCGMIHVTELTAIPISKCTARGH